MTKPNYPPCPRCRTARGVIASGDRLFYCHGCKMQFDDDPDEGGDYSDRSPATRLEREERNESKRMARIGGRRRGTVR